MQKLQFFGASGTVTGSNFLLTADDGQELVVDFGMFQGTHDVVELNYKKLSFNAAKLSGVVLTHAHLDHCGRLPLLVYAGFLGKIYMTKPTLALMELVLLDAAKIAKENTSWMPLYTEDEVIKVLNMVETVEYETPFTIGGFSVTLKDAGHILGAASAVITEESSKKTIVFSGDLGNYPEDVVRPTEFIDKADYVVMESTYGDKSHTEEDASQALQEEINIIEKNPGVLLVPAFSLERTQEILHRLHHLKKDGKIAAETLVFLDSPMGIRATRIFEEFKQYFNEELRSHTDDPFHFPGLSITETVEESKGIRTQPKPKVIIAGSGMMSGGRILHHAIHYFADASTRVLFVGYQGEETTGRKILEGAKHVVIDEKQVQINATIHHIEAMSSHADQGKLLKWFDHIQGVKTVFLVHGDEEQRKIFSEKIKAHSPTVILPMLGDEHTFS